ncbi:ABC transporter ATP-binding protein [bacterium]|nr:ABC transporter ATP-binding protein [bacterium]
MRSVIEIEGLEKVYRSGVRRRNIHALDGLDLSVAENEIFGFLGPNGAGKTTTLKILTGLLFQTSGTARVLGKAAGDLSTKAQMGFLPESPHFYEYLTSRELLDFYCRLFRIHKASRRKKVDELLASVGLEHAADLRVRKHSQGMKQRLGIAQSLVGNPKVLLLDEPMSGLDPMGRRQIREMIRKLASDGMTIFFSSHILSDAELLCDRVGILVKGRLVDVGKMADILKPRMGLFEAIASGVDGACRERLEGICKRVALRDDRLHLEISGEDNLREAERAIIEAGGVLDSLSRMRTTLEDHFMEFLKPDEAAK